MGQQDKYKPALSYRWLTRLYDPLVRVALKRYDFMERLVAHANVRAGDHVLDLGCGSARLSMMLKSKHPNCSIVGLDADTEILQIARRNIQEANYNIHLVQGMSFEMPFAKSTFDRVVSSLLFHHLTTHDKCRTLGEIRRVLKPGGTLHIVDWGRPQNFIMRLAFLPVQIFDGFNTTGDNVRGLIPQFMKEAGFEEVIEVEQIRTVGGTLSLYSATRPG